MKDPSAPVDRGRLALSRALPILLATACFGLVIALLAWRTVQNFDALQDQGASQEFALLSGACDGESLAAAPAYGGGSSLHPMVAFRRAGDAWRLAPEVIPAESRPQQLADVELVLCIGEPQIVSVPLCEPADNQTNLTGPQIEVTLVAAQTGATVSRQPFGLAVPDSGCLPPGASAPVPDDAAIWAWAGRFVGQAE